MFLENGNVGKFYLNHSPIELGSKKVENFFDHFYFKTHILLIFSNSIFNAICYASERTYIESLIDFRIENKLANLQLDLLNVNCSHQTAKSTKIIKNKLSPDTIK